MTTLIQMEFHLEKGNAPISVRVDVLLEAAEKGLRAGSIYKVEEILDKIQRLKNGHEDQNVEIAIRRLRAWTKIFVGKSDAALRCLKNAMDVAFPEDPESGFHIFRKNDVQLRAGEYRCLFLECHILIALGWHDRAARIGRKLEKFVLKEKLESSEVVLVRILYLRAVSKMKPGKWREKTTYRLVKDIHQDCFSRLVELPVVNIEELETILTASTTLVQVLFESAKLDACKKIGHKTFQLLKILNHPRLLVRVLFWLTLTDFYEKDYAKCHERLSHLQDAYQQSDDPISEVIYQTALVKLMREAEMSAESQDQVKICMDYTILGSDVETFHPKHSNKIYCLSSLMALRCMENNLEPLFPVWYRQALKLQKNENARFNSYWNLLGTLCLERVKILKKRETFFMLTKSEMASFKKYSNKVIGNIENQVKKFVPILERGVLDVKTCLKRALKECEILKA